MPFDSDYRYMAKLVRLADGTKKLYIKGSPDKLLPMAKACDPNFDEAHYLAWTSERSKHGQRVIAVGSRVVNVDEISHDLLAEGIDFLGLAA